MAAPTTPWFRELHDQILGYRRYSLFFDVLTPWIQKAQAAIAEFERFKACLPYARNDRAAQDAMWNLYALSRVNDLLLLSFQTARAESKIATITWDEYETFFMQLGFTVVGSDEFSPFFHEAKFSPFYHEIVQVHQSEDDQEPIRVIEHLWPALRFGDLLFSRSGVEVIGGRKHVIKDVAEQSTLYFTYRRYRRKTSDLSMGWGSNSQWRTDLRRDYRSGNMLVYNADGTNSLNSPRAPAEDRDGLTHEERVELCKNRCFITTSKEDHDLWPYDDHIEEPSC